ncbi:hypothetical protein MSAN_01960600 [Mycena sanguinolenta]|uniref:Uncharacterized protein n=1 Tax=Mycena sanguinolenta TaxID=230812 RepID=A0A8H7CPS1_9AGAR|nr:hypothetical protein MSAN_01960600 [Mycena sanguinolenta]
MSIEPRDRVPSPSRKFNSNFPQALPPNELIASAPERIHHRHATPQFDVALSHARSSFLAILLTLLLDINFRLQLRAILLLLDSLNAESPSMFRQRMQLVFTRFSPPNSSCLLPNAFLIDALFYLLLTLLLDIEFRSQLRIILASLDTVNADDPLMFQQRMQPVFTPISHFPLT